ncbi:LarC family nickel insertion protein [Paraliobacillus sp. X-1268]|uniref:LarC family nickel insertion protein n=1 Tax=Paraliobacillus sp. X-1268 TaxID=2213193 RepID=UPI000E3C3B0F|nr:LarC family nickel insertion protein [Paraliobacillus sp. X-1268]
MRVLYLDCFSGISGDMTIAALLDAGASLDLLERELNKLNITSEYELKCEKVIRNGITSSKFDVILLNEKNNSDNHVHTHTEEHAHDHAHSHNHDHHQRTYREIVKMINNASLVDRAKEYALAIFKKIGEAEASIHGVSLEEVHFHEVGAVDSIIDIVGTAILIDQLKIERIIASSVPVGSGHIHIDHGIYPVPAPATLEMLRGVPIATSNVHAELTTPTGAAIVSVLSSDFGTFPEMKVNEIGYGAGTKIFTNHPNVLRVVIGDKE